jgi:threonine-phosphate decarboxylase
MLYQTENPHGGNLYAYPGALDFSANTNPLGASDAVRKAAIESLSYMDRYPDPYCRELVTAIACFEGVPETYVLCGCGAAELIFSYCYAVRPKCALELAPTFSEYSSALKAVGCWADQWFLKSENSFTVDRSFCGYLEKGHWDAVFLCNPNNPTGQLIEPDLLEHIAKICHNKGTRLFVDECFLDLTDFWQENSLKRLLPQYPGLFILKAFTKSYGMAGLRLGYCLSGDNGLLSAMARFSQPWNVSSPAQAAGIAALGQSDFLEQTRSLIQQERPWLEKNLNTLGLDVYPSCTNYILFYSQIPLLEKLAVRGIVIRDCSNYEGLAKGWYRIAVRQHRENIRLVSALKEILLEES